MFEVRDNDDRREQPVKRLEVYTDSESAREQTKRKSTSGAVIMAEGSRGSGFSGVEQFVKQR